MVRKILFWISYGFIILGFIFAIITFSCNSKYNKLQKQLTNKEISEIEKLDIVEQAGECRKATTSWAVAEGIILCINFVLFTTTICIPQKDKAITKSKVR